MAKGSNFTGEILHFGAVRFRITGSGTLLSQFNSLDDFTSQAIPNIVMSATTNKEPTVLSNFNQQRAYLYCRVTGIDQDFSISKIIIYVKPVASGFLQ